MHKYVVVNSDNDVVAIVVQEEEEVSGTRIKLADYDTLPNLKDKWDGHRFVPKGE